MVPCVCILSREKRMVSSHLPLPNGGQKAIRTVAVQSFSRSISNHPWDHRGRRGKRTGGVERQGGVGWSAVFSEELPCAISTRCLVHLHPPSRFLRLPLILAERASQALSGHTLLHPACQLSQCYPPAAPLTLLRLQCLNMVTLLWDAVATTNRVRDGESRPKGAGQFALAFDLFYAGQGIRWSLLCRPNREWTIVPEDCSLMRSCCAS